jgi:hypothetical protein
VLKLHEKEEAHKARNGLFLATLVYLGMGVLLCFKGNSEPEEDHAIEINRSLQDLADEDSGERLIG